MMKWVQQKPDKAGWYWLQIHPGLVNMPPQIVWVDKIGDQFKCIGIGDEIYEFFENNWLWYGPLEPPDQP